MEKHRKISYATYVKDRYTGFDGDSPRNAPADLKLFPSFLQRLANEGGTPKYARPMCVGEVKSKGQGELGKDIANLKAAMEAHGIERGFMNAASPGVISLFLQNDHYPTREAYLAALADAMKEEYETIVAAGLDLQLDCPDLALSPPHALHRPLGRRVREGRGKPRRGAEPRAVGHPRGPRAHPHLLGQIRGAACLATSPMSRMFDTLMSAKARICSCSRTSNPRHGHEWAVFRDRKADIPEDKVLVPRRRPTRRRISSEHPDLVAQRIERFVGHCRRQSA